MYDISYFREKLCSSPSWAERAIIVLYQLQTEEERTIKETYSKNGLGFNSVDANILSSFAEWINSGRHLTPNQLAIAYKKLPKYSKQLHSIAYN